MVLGSLDTKTVKFSWSAQVKTQMFVTGSWGSVLLFPDRVFGGDFNYT